jgi:hypothetical protein
LLIIPSEERRWCQAAAEGLAGSSAQWAAAHFACSLQCTAEQRSTTDLSCHTNDAISLVTLRCQAHASLVPVIHAAAAAAAAAAPFCPTAAAAAAPPFPAAAAAARWAKGEAGPGPNDFGFNERFEFYTNSKAKQYYKDYVAAIVNRYK